MDMNWSAEDLAFRDEVRAFLNKKLTPELRRAGSLATSVYADHDASMEWQRILLDKGWAAPAWPVEWGGCDWRVTQHYIFTRECVAAGAPSVSPMGIRMVAYAILQFGTPQQKAFYLPRILNGEHFWCQGYSEPGSGSDLASLQMAALDDGDHLVCTGSKIWTTHANVANWIFCLVRTTKGAKRQSGITFLLIDMKTPGVDVRPIIMTSGEHVQNMVFFDAVRVPKANALGQIDDGWTVAKYLLEFERGGSCYAPALQVQADEIARQAGKLRTAGAVSELEAASFQARLAAAQARIDVLETLEFQILSSLSRGQGAGASASVMKILGTELHQHLTELALEVAGPRGAIYAPHAVMPGGPTPYFHGANEPFEGEAWQAAAPLRYLNHRAGSIYAGSNEIQRNILAKALLGL
jgi:alkylation response protein AidB-like acyl-CoA dehydrogenase